MSTGDLPQAACGCGDGSTVLTPASVANASGHSALSYRVGTHGSFKATMQAALSRQASLAGLTARHDADPSIALLDAWAIVLDALTFYQERIANEGYVRTAIERRSILELARAIGYELNPGVAAGAVLAFTMDGADGSPASVILEAGTKVQSVPGPNELPQLFETTEALDARPAWNALHPQTAERVYPDIGSTTVYLKGTSTNLKSGDRLLVVGDERLRDPESDRFDVRRVKTVAAVPPSTPTADLAAGFTIVELDRGLGQSDPKRRPATANPQVYALRQRAALFGANAPDWLAMSTAVKKQYGGDSKSTQWPHFNVAYEDEVPLVVDELYLDAVYPSISTGSWLVLSLLESDELFSVRTVTEASKTDFTLTAKTTLVELDGPALSKPFTDGLREIVVFAVSELLDWADAPMSSPVSGAAVTLDTHVEGLPVGRLLIASGTDAVTGESRSEVLSLARTEERDGLTRLVFTTALVHSYVRASLTFSANVAPATHGETKTEILGSGDGARRFQTFALKQKPLTHVSAATAGGSETTLAVRVNDILWDEVPALYGSGPADRVYVTRLSDDGTVTVEFGDGVTGARLPTGTENVTATYRVGSGLGGVLNAGQVSLLMSRPLGLAGATNPLPTSGAADAELLDQARQNAPLTVLTMERIVSLQDCEDFVRAFAGIGKAQATLLWNGERQMVHVTIAGADGGPVDPSSALYGNLRMAIDAARHATHAIRIDSFLPQTFDTDARVLVDSHYVAKDVMARVVTAMEQVFSFEGRELGQAVTKSEVLGVMQGVEGVVAVDLDSFHPTGGPRGLPVALVSSRAHWELDTVVPATLLTVRPEGVVLTEMR
jgi:predicted phage baseplate assembly protein